MTNPKTNEAEHNITKAIRDALNARLDVIGIPSDCVTRDISWDEAADECYTLSNTVDLHFGVKYLSAMYAYKDADRIWNALMSSSEILK